MILTIRLERVAKTAPLSRAVIFFQRGMNMNGKDIYELLAKQNIRLFNLSIDNDTMTFIHTNKTVEELMMTSLIYS